MPRRPPPLHLPADPAAEAPWAVDAAGEEAVDGPAVGGRATTSSSRPAPVRRRPAVLAAAAAVLVALPLVGRLAASDRADDIVLLPPRGDVHADVLADGTPVFVVQERTQRPLVLEALVPDARGVGEAVGWCAPTRQLVAPHGGAVFDALGWRYARGVRGRDGAAGLVADVDGRRLDLVARSTTRVPGFEGPGDPVRVGDPLAPGADRGAPPPSRAATRTTPPSWCRAPAPSVRDTGIAAVDDPQLRGHGDDLALPLGEALRADRRGRWQVVAAAVTRAPDGTAAACDRLDDRARQPLCPGGSVPVTAFDAEPSAGAWMALEGPLLVRTDGRAVVDVAVLPASRWRGAGLLGVEVHRGLLGRYRPEDGTIRWRSNAVVSTPDASFPCVAEDLTGPALVLDEDAVVALGAPLVDAAPGERVALAPADLAAATGTLGTPSSPDVPVEAVVDRSTCRVLSVQQLAAGT